MHMKQSKPRITRILCGYLALLLGASVAFAQQSARPVRDWVRDGVIYEIYPRAFSQKGDFNAITARAGNASLSSNNWTSICIALSGVRSS